MSLVRRPLAAAVAVAISIAALGACNSSSSSSSAAADPNDVTTLPRPKEGSVEAGFARDMSVHHAQAVAMAEAIRDRTTDPDLKIFATNIALGQQAQIGRMSGWLDEWGLPQSSTATPMAWIRSDNLLSGGGSAGGMDMGTSDTMTLGADGLMPGMATRPQVSALGTLPIAQAEISFLQLMIAHHTAGVEMAQAVLARTSRPDVIRLATSIINGQQAEITVMKDMLAKRGATP
ncbi:MAG: hypothetical protein JWM34_2262 [Ilumatobacteraceae bacterium]|nr:hypothetical protein [Ilumatobacteraceae bacterium]